MKRLSRKQAQALVNEMEQAANGKDWETWHKAHVCQRALLEFPTGELFNPNLLGFLWVWRLNGELISRPIAEGDRLNANGLEGKVSVETCLTTALLAWRNLPQYRRLISLI